jgi:acetyl-CoA carboxylase biotin carboxylase subunit
VIRRLLIANRGEIALRIIRACRSMDIETVAVYSDADVRAPHVMAADAAVRLGPPPASESYLSIPLVLAAVRESRADAVHPGYGFLSENAAFASECEEAGITFVGPPSRAIRSMGSKIRARQLMQSAGVPVVPGETPRDQSESGLRQAIDRVGLPALVKASAGGGGKGMRLVREAAEIGDAVASARREATAAFGDGTLYVERFVERPRHIEVQVFADNGGDVVHVFERECSVQRRHQKVIEESPSPALTPRLRERMTAAAVRAAKAAEYRNAGTIEFLLEGAGDEAQFYFLEMNTRLQVEHPVTESVAGVDLVRAQLLVASGERLPWPAGSLVQRGHAIEARVYAEDPDGGFLPQAGRVRLYREPRMPGVRVDSGIAEGVDVTVHYDPLLAKVIASGETREVATARLIAALSEFPILGLRTNLPFLLRVLEHPRFRAAAIDTSFLDAEGASLAASAAHELPAVVRAAVATHTAATDGRGASLFADDGRSAKASAEREDPWSDLGGWGR